MNVIACLVLQVIMCQLVRCQDGGPSTFGYDASSACGKPYSRSGRARLSNLPCDFRRQSWCGVAGNSYPWHAVRRFVQENQGLMRRMYGDERHLNVLRAEFEKNDVELNYEDYYHPADDYRKYPHLRDYEFLDGEEEEEEEDDDPRGGSDFEGRGFTGRSFHENGAKRSKFPKLSEYTRPHFRPTERSSATTGTSPASSSTDPSSSTVTASRVSVSTASSAILFNDTERNETEEASSPTREQNFSINEIPEQIDRIDEDVGAVDVSESTGDDSSTIDPPDVTVLPGETEEETLLATPKETTVQEETSAEQQEFRPRPEYRPAGKPEASTMEGQLYQDVAAKDQQEQPVLKLRGVNACPVKEEVVAPFWANNTRGEVLALLNLYPFEQYVHWEKCTHENKQMYCREGCRCEQQYRLHRLLAYDPNNECRGIFSDWFKFPSCCVCRCYDLPLEFRVTSRSPRSQKQRIKIRPPQPRFA